MTVTKHRDIEMVVIGGSAGCLSVLMEILKSLPDNFPVPVVVIIHRQRNVMSELAKIIGSAVPGKVIVEPDDKEPIGSSSIYLAPQNYHLLFEADRTFSLDYSEPIKFSRPSIDVTFESAARVYKDKLMAVLLSGANNDGTAGMISIVENGGTAIAQDPETAEFRLMPVSAIEKVKNIRVMPAQMIAFELARLAS